MFARVNVCTLLLCRSLSAVARAIDRMHRSRSLLPIPYKPLPDSFRRNLPRIIPAMYSATRVQDDPYAAIDFANLLLGRPSLSVRTTAQALNTCIACEQTPTPWATMVSFIADSNSWVRAPINDLAGLHERAFLEKCADRVVDAMRELYARICEVGRNVEARSIPGKVLLDCYLMGLVAIDKFGIDGNAKGYKFDLIRTGMAPRPLEPVPGHVYAWAEPDVFGLGWPGVMLSDQSCADFLNSEFDRRKDEGRVRVCNGFKADAKTEGDVSSKSQKVVSGIFLGVCGHMHIHQCCHILGKGERWGYGAFLYQNLAPRAMIRSWFYDINCRTAPWIEQVHRELFPDLIDPLTGLPRPLPNQPLPVFHQYMHDAPCLHRNGPNHCEGSGRQAGEATEIVNAAIAAVARTLRYAGPLTDRLMMETMFMVLNGERDVIGQLVSNLKGAQNAIKLQNEFIQKDTPFEKDRTAFESDCKLARRLHDSIKADRPQPILELTSIEMDIMWLVLCQAHLGNFYGSDGLPQMDVEAIKGRATELGLEYTGNILDEGPWQLDIRMGPTNVPLHPSGCFQIGEKVRTYLGPFMEYIFSINAQKIMQHAAALATAQETHA